MDLAEAVPIAGNVVGERLLIAAPFYRNPQLVAPLLDSLLHCGDELVRLGAELVLYNDSPEDGELAAALSRAVPALAALVPCRIEVNPENLGFVRTMNRAVMEAVARRRDLLLLNSDTRVSPGALTEMQRVSLLDPMVAFVNPRSNNATLATLPLQGRIAGRDPAVQGAMCQAFAVRLPEMSFVPTAVGFCMLVRWHILAEFGGFDEIYGQGYNEENDLVMRAARCGYRAVLANRAFVWHDGEASFGAAAETRDVLERRNRAILDARYPEYACHAAAHSDSAETTAERLLAELVPDPDGRIDVALDFSSFRTDHNGTFRAGRQLLEAAAVGWAGRFRLFVIATRDVYDFHGYAETGVPRVDPHDARVFGAVLRMGQPYDWNAVQRLMLRGAAVGAFMLDTISVDCPQLASPRLFNMWQFLLSEIDVLVTQSRHTAQQFASRFRIPERVARLVSLHSLDLSEYRFAGAGDDSSDALLVVGNHFFHKHLSPTAGALAAAFPERQVVALGVRIPAPGSRPQPRDPALPGPAPNLRLQPAGELDEAAVGALYHAAGAVIFPSHAEGFGFPLLHALAAEKPVFVRRLPVFAEVDAALGGNPNVQFYDCTSELIEKLSVAPRWVTTMSSPATTDAVGSAREIFAALEQAVAAASYARIVERVRAVQFASDISQPEGGLRPGASHAEVAAYFIARWVERAVVRVLRWKPAYAASRLVFRGGRRIGALLRH